MSSDVGPPRDLTVVILSSRVEFARTLRQRCEQAQMSALATPDAYAAAVMLLVSGRTALVIDLDTLRRDQLGLVSLAERLGVAAYGFGQSAQPWAELAALPRVRGEDIPAVLLGAAPQVPAETKPSPLPVAAPPPAKAVPADTDAALPLAQLLTDEETRALLEDPNP